MVAKYKSFEELSVGVTASIKRKVTAEDVRAYAEVTGDMNPMHLDDDYARKTVFGGRIAHGMYLGGLISSVLAQKLPGTGYAYLSQTLEFLRPVRIGDTVTVEVELLEKIEDEKKLRFKTICRNQDGKIVVQGEATGKAIL
ncbi:MAG: MaoC family dehydratase [Candidatus Altiarchaeota archaeon]